jgi:hypothetical protein
VESAVCEASLDRRFHAFCRARRLWTTGAETMRLYSFAPRETRALFTLSRA